MRVNMNDEVWIRLTDKGRAMLRADHEQTLLPGMLKLNPFKPPVESQGWLKLQLWELARVFGPGFGNGQPVPFETEIALKDPRMLICSDCRGLTDENGDCPRCRRAHS
jgi:hypothetical protein